jgi:hypothetical protein
MKTFKDIIDPFIFCLVLMAFAAGGINCATAKKEQDSFDIARYSAKNWIKTEKYKRISERKKKAQENGTEASDIGSGSSIIGMLSDLPIKEPEMEPDEREYLDDQCSGCHELNRVFWTRGSTYKWKKLLAQEYHHELELEPDDEDRLLEIFQKYLNQS